jgi:hypothetical protein
MAALAAACLFFELGYRAGVNAKYGSDAAHDETLDMLMQCADDLEQSASEVRTLAVSCVEACKGCPDVCEQKCEERCDD